jgi:hypothetical protein
VRGAASAVAGGVPPGIIVIVWLRKSSDSPAAKFAQISPSFLNRSKTSAFVCDLPSSYGLLNCLTMQSDEANGSGQFVAAAQTGTVSRLVTSQTAAITALNPLIGLRRKTEGGFVLSR